MPNICGYYLHWPKTWDRAIVTASKKFRRKHYVDWKLARATSNILDEIPETISNRHLSIRLNQLQKGQRKSKPPKKKYDYKKRWKEKLILYRKEVSQNIKDKVGLKTRKLVMTDKEWRLLCKIVRRYRKNKNISWQGVVSDKEFAKLPNYDLAYIRRYYSSRMWRIRPHVREKRKKDALKYKYEHLNRYNSLIADRRKKIRKAVNTYLIETI